MTSPFAPVWRTPAAPGMLSNKRGSNFGADAIGCLVRYSHPLGATADSPSAIRVTAYRTVAQGTPQAAELVWDSSLQGHFGYTAPSGLPTPVNSGPGGVPSYAACVASLSSDPSGPARVYATFGTYHIYSAPVAGTGIGPWRLEIDLRGLPGFTLPPIQIFQTGDPAVAPTPFMQVFSTDGATLIHKRLAIAGDGALSVAYDGDWVNLNTVATIQQVIPGSAVGSSCTALLAGGVWGLQAATTAVTQLALDENGIIQNLVARPSLPMALRGVAGFFDRTAGVGGQYYIIGGDSGAGAVSTIFGGLYIYGGAWAALATGIPAARSRHAVVVAGGYVYVVGGQLTGVAQATVYYHLFSTLGTAWSTGTPLPNATQDQGTVIQAAAGMLTIGVYGGTYAPGTVEGSILTAGANGAWITGPATAMTAATVGSGGTFVINPDGSADIGFLYGGFGGAAVPLLDGDQVQLAIVLYEKNGGADSSSALTLIKIGQPPALTAIVPANASTVTTGRPGASVTVNPGLGGAQEKSYRIRVTQGGSPILDTGILYDGANAAIVRPALGQSLSNLAYALVLDVASLDVPMPGSTASVTSTTTFNGPTSAAPSVPTAFTAVPDGLDGWTLLSWTDQVDATGFARLYKKAAGASTWVLYKDNQVSLGVGAAHSFQAMEEIAFGVAYDYAVSSVNATGVESPLTTVLDAAGNSKLIPPKQPSDARYTIMLHVVGSGPAQNVGLQLVLIGSRGHAATIVTNQDAQPIVGFGNKAPTIRTGIYNYRSIALKPIFIGPAALAEIEAVMIAAMGGSTLCYRDTLGTIIYCGPEATRTRSEGHAHEDDLTLLETSFIYVP